MQDDDIDVSDLPAELQMDRYDDEDFVDEHDDDEDVDEHEDLYEVLGMGGGGLAMDADSDDDLEDAEDDEILPTDRLIVVAATEDEQRCVHDCVNRCYFVHKCISTFCYCLSASFII